MSADSILPRPGQRLLGRLVRIEYLGFENTSDHREYRLAVHGPDGPTEVRCRIAHSAFSDGRVRIQDGAEVCYQKLLRAVTAGETTSADVVTIDDAELASYREAHTVLPRHRTFTAALPQKPPFVPRRQPLPAPAPPVATPDTNDSQGGLAAGQRVSHVAFGAGVIASSGGGHTVVHFDEGGPRTFVTRMVDLEVLSAPHTWETGPRGKNRPRETALVSR
jgi:hypothetical protein